MTTIAVEVSPQTRRAFVVSGDHVKQNGHVTDHMTQDSANIGDHMTSEGYGVTDHVTSNIITAEEEEEEEEGGGGMSMEESDEEESTAGEGGDTFPYESTTTDTIPDPVDPVDFIENHPRSFSAPTITRNGHHPNSKGVAISHLQRYENWNAEMQEKEVEEGVKKGRIMKRWKASRVGVKDRQRGPYPLPRQIKMKNQHLRPSPASRKRRFSNKIPRTPFSNASEGDMAQADEMGEGEGKDDGFVDCSEGYRRKNKKRPGLCAALVCEN